jgi:hypothetical protein
MSEFERDVTQDEHADLSEARGCGWLWAEADGRRDEVGERQIELGRDFRDPAELETPGTLIRHAQDAQMYEDLDLGGWLIVKEISLAAAR